MRHLYDTGESREIRMEIENVINSSTPKLARNGLCHVYFAYISGILLLKCNNELFSLQKIVCLPSSRKVTTMHVVELPEDSC